MESAKMAAAQMKKYWHVINIGIQNNLAYRFNFLARTLFGLIPLTAMLMLWRTIYAGKGPDALVGTYTLAEMISYYLVVTLVAALTTVSEDDWQIAADIRDGSINHFLAKPMDYLAYRLCLFCSGRVIYLAVAALPLAGFMFLMREYLRWPADVATLGWFALSVILTALLQFFTSYALAMLAFWVLEVSTFIFIVYAFEYIASGHLFPLDILPAGLQRVLVLTPFPYELYFPVSIYLGKVQGAQLLQGLALQTFWVAMAYLGARFAWHRGIRRYGAVGG
jgi:ABC-2 type transport system permease protein